MLTLNFFHGQNDNFDRMLVLHRGNQLSVQSLLHRMEKIVFQCRLVSEVLLCFSALIFSAHLWRSSLC